MSGTFPDASLNDLQAAQFWLMTEPGLAALCRGTSTFLRVAAYPGGHVRRCRLCLGRRCEL